MLQRVPHPVSTLLAALLASACAGPLTTEADTVVDAPGASGEGFGDPNLAINGVRGGGAHAQSLDVYSIRHDSHLILSWAGRRVVDGPGVDLVVFENPFEYGDGLTFMDPTVVEVSDDGERWTALAHDYRAPDEHAYSAHAAHWVGFAGVAPVHRHEEDAPIDPFDPMAGGDRFDLADSGVSGFRFVRLSSAAAHVNPDTGEPFVHAFIADGPDIDGVHARGFE